MAVAAAASVAVTSCVEDNGECITPEDVKKDGFQLRFQIVTRGTSPSRVVLDPIVEVEGTAYENFLNLDDIKYYIFDSNKKFICELKPDAVTVVANTMYTLYDVVAKVDDDYFKNNINGTLDFYIIFLLYTSDAADE